jgi:hypothetical protein
MAVPIDRKDAKKVRDNERRDNEMGTIVVSFCYNA